MLFQELLLFIRVLFAGISWRVYEGDGKKAKINLVFLKRFSRKAAFLFSPASLFSGFTYFSRNISCSALVCCLFAETGTTVSFTDACHKSMFITKVEKSWKNDVFFLKNIRKNPSICTQSSTLDFSKLCRGEFDEVRFFKKVADKKYISRGKKAMIF